MRWVIPFAVLLASCASPLPGEDRTDGGATSDLGAVKDLGEDASDSGIEDPTDMGSNPDASLALPTSFGITAGGGRAGSMDFRARITVGAPVPVGSASSAEYRLSIGTGAVIGQAP